jgi:dephospho-CoA kinase
VSKHIFGLTGGIASGKSTVTALFIEEGIPMVDADLVARDIVVPGRPALAMLVSSFGSEILLEDGTLDRPKLASIVFLDARKRANLDQILHSYLIDGIRAEIIKANEYHNLVGLDAAILIEKGLHHEYRPLIVVAVSPEVQLQRLMSRDGFNPKEAQARIDSQLPISEKVKLADYVLWNDGTKDDLIKQALKVIAALKNL